MITISCTRIHNRCIGGREGPIVVLAASLAYTQVQRFHPQSFLFCKPRPNFRIGRSEIAIAEKSLLEVSEIIIWDWIKELFQIRELLNPCLAHGGDLPHGARLRRHRTDAESLTLRPYGCPLHGAIHNSRRYNSLL